MTQDAQGDLYTSVEIYRQMVIDAISLAMLANQAIAAAVLGNKISQDFGSHDVSVVRRILERIGDRQTGQAVFQTIEGHTTTDRQITIIPDLCQRLASGNAPFNALRLGLRP